MLSDKQKRQIYDQYGEEGLKMGGMLAMHALLSKHPLRFRGNTNSSLNAAGVHEFSSGKHWIGWNSVLKRW